MSDQLDPHSPSMRLWHTLLRLGATEDEATGLMKDYAHELGDKIRKQKARLNLILPEFEQAWEAGLHRGADIIDPEGAE